MAVEGHSAVRMAAAVGEVMEGHSAVVGMVAAVMEVEAKEAG